MKRLGFSVKLDDRLKDFDNLSWWLFREFLNYVNTNHNFKIDNNEMIIKIDNMKTNRSFTSM